jgi:isoaspartyl peptidase/L-asparaginase-like protein (Ntn-hydrolase superfamily)
VAKAVWSTPTTPAGRRRRQEVRLEEGFKEQNLLTEEKASAWLRWNRSSTRATTGLEGDGDVRPSGHTGTINMNCVDAAGNIASLTSTSGLAWKIPGRVGDSPILGAGQYCDNEVGAAGATGRGEAVMKVCGAFLIVELMRARRIPQEPASRPSAASSP